MLLASGTQRLAQLGPKTNVGALIIRMGVPSKGSKRATMRGLGFEGNNNNNNN